MSHTPGPWETRIGAADQVFVVGGSRICTVMPKHDEPHRDHDEDAANARLISAAPELLTAMQAFIALDANFSKDLKWARGIVSDGGKSAPLASVVILAREAIAKATGGAP